MIEEKERQSEIVRKGLQLRRAQEQRAQNEMSILLTLLY